SGAARGLGRMSRAHPLRVADYLQHILEAIGNIAKNHPDFAAQHAAVPWGFAYEMRNAIAHGYYQVDLEQVQNQWGLQKRNFGANNLNGTTRNRG
ncbi:MAG: HepT-like ribonuclease domain-containing protein, partial [Methylophilaceae bacterium]